MRLITYSKANLARFDHKFLIICNLYDKIEKILPGINFWIAGGALRNIMESSTARTDIDIFSDQPLKINQILDKIGQPGQPKLHSKEYLVNINAGLVTDRLDIVQKSYKNLQETLESFDFTNSAIGIDKASIMLHERFNKDLVSKSLVPLKISSPVATLRRIMKFAAQGYTMKFNQMREVLQQIQKLKIEDEPVITYDNTQVWLNKDSLPHKIDGPAKINPDGTQEWLIHGVKWS